MKTVFVANNPAEAHVVAGLLEEEGLRTSVEGEMLFGVRGDLGLSASSLPTVSVNDEDAALALELIAAREKDPDAASEELDEEARPRRSYFGHAAFIVVIWLCVGSVAAAATGFIAVPFVAVALFVHLLFHLDRAS